MTNFCVYIPNLSNFFIDFQRIIACLLTISFILILQTNEVATRASNRTTKTTKTTKTTTKKTTKTTLKKTTKCKIKTTAKQPFIVDLLDRKIDTIGLISWYPNINNMMINQACPWNDTDSIF